MRGFLKKSDKFTSGMKSILDEQKEKIKKVRKEKNRDMFVSHVPNQYRSNSDELFVDNKY